ncbi:hypothetical protein ACJIZ3_011664 [Penstemon smallii]|uniref:Homeobox domain-containing protein n=1 Tax=Penstemon smallii TaxID=265156 RepID=A0ABD3UJV6_9LAMI
MEPLKGNQLIELAFPKMSYQNLLESQKDVIQNQIENLLEVVEFQCKLTGVNPLSQEMAAGALSIKIGKKPRDLLNPKAVKYMQFVFSIKDAISKRETREISVRFGVTVTQVRDFFAGQRTRVRKFVRMSREKTDKSAASDARPDEMTSTSDPSMPAEPVPLDTVAPIQVEEGPSCSTRHEVPPGMEESDIYFTENIFRLMRKEESFAGQVKLLQWILRMENPSVTTWFLNEGGVILLATWLSEAATEEQTSVLRLILDVLCHLPLKKASSVHMSAVLQSVNRLRFYRTPDVANRSTILIAQWTKLFQKIQASKKSKSAGEAQDEMLLKQRQVLYRISYLFKCSFTFFRNQCVMTCSIQEVMGNESLELRDDNSREALRLLCENPSYPRKLDTAPPLKLLTASGDDSHKRRGVLSSRILLFGY